MALSTGREWLRKLYEAGLIPESTQRVVIDISLTDLPKVYVEQIGVDRTLDVLLTLDGAEIVTVPPPKSGE